MAATGQDGVLIGPLTTAWSMPATCTINFNVCSTCSDLYRGQKCVTTSNFNDSPLEDTHECWPPRNTRLVDAPRNPLMGWGFYSPGLACPTGYTSACTAVYNQRPEWDIQFKLRPGETAVGCCPEGYKCVNRLGNGCMAIASTGMELPTAWCPGTGADSPTLAPLTPELFTITNKENSEVSTVEGTFTMWAPLFQLNFQSSDLETSTSAPETSSRTELPESTQPRATASESQPTQAQPTQVQPTKAQPTSEPSSEDDNGGGLSTGLAAGIGAGVAVASILAISLIVFMFWRRRRGRKVNTSNHGGSMGEEKPTSGGYMRHQSHDDGGWGTESYEMSHSAAQTASGPDSTEWYTATSHPPDRPHELQVYRRFSFEGNGSPKPPTVITRACPAAELVG